jgi:hypothetical protein
VSTAPSDNFEEVGKGSLFGRGTMQRGVIDTATVSANKFALQLADVLADVSKPSKERCDRIFSDKGYKGGLVQAETVFTSAAPFNAYEMKRRLMHGPVVGTVRLSWEFQTFTGSLFNPAGKQTFCRRAKVADVNDYCDPARAEKWDAEQRAQQVRPAGMDRESWVDTWYNHFVTVHGWGVKRGQGENSGVRYFVVENSWGRIYENDASAGNNGAGSFYRVNHFYGNGDGKDHLIGKNHFLLIAEDAAGEGGLEITSREVYMATFSPPKKN